MRRTAEYRAVHNALARELNRPELFTPPKKKPRHDARPLLPADYVTSEQMRATVTADTDAGNCDGRHRRGQLCQLE